MIRFGAYLWGFCCFFFPPLEQFLFSCAPLLPLRILRGRFSSCFSGFSLKFSALVDAQGGLSKTQALRGEWLGGRSRERQAAEQWTRTDKSLPVFLSFFFRFFLAVLFVSGRIGAADCLFALGGDLCFGHARGAIAKLGTAASEGGEKPFVHQCGTASGSLQVFLPFLFDYVTLVGYVCLLGRSVEGSATLILPTALVGIPPFARFEHLSSSIGFPPVFSGLTLSTCK